MATSWSAELPHAGVKLHDGKLEERHSKLGIGSLVLCLVLSRYWDYNSHYPSLLAMLAQADECHRTKYSVMYAKLIAILKWQCFALKNGMYCISSKYN